MFYNTDSVGTGIQKSLKNFCPLWDWAFKSPLSDDL